MTGKTFHVEPAENGMVRIRTDAPGERATSVLVDPREAITKIRSAAGFAQDNEQPAAETPVDPAEPVEEPETPDDPEPPPEAEEAPA